MSKKDKVTARVIAKGFYKGKPTVVEVLRHGGGLDENDDWQKGELSFIKDGMAFKNLSEKDIENWTNSKIEKVIQIKRYFCELRHCIVKCYLRQMKAVHVYNPMPNTIEAYWLAFNYGDGFDEVPEIIVEGKIDTLGSPFSDEDTRHIRF